jgi:hypothetical protein
VWTAVGVANRGSRPRAIQQNGHESGSSVPTIPAPFGVPYELTLASPYLPTAAMLCEGGYEVEGFREPFGIKGEFVNNLEEVIEKLVLS